MRILYVDCFSGISGDMFVGALTDLGVAPSVFEWELTKITLEDHHLHFERQQRKGIAGIKFGMHAGSVHVHSEDEHSNDHDHQYHRDQHDHTDHHHQAEDEPELAPTAVHRTYRDIVELINDSELSDRKSVV